MLFVEPSHLMSVLRFSVHLSGGDLWCLHEAGVNEGLRADACKRTSSSILNFRCVLFICAARPDSIIHNRGPYLVTHAGRPPA